MLLYVAKATYENNGGVCEDILQTKDSVFKYTPTTLKPLIVYVYSINEPVKTDTIFVKAE
jgi:hypothetical protein